MSDEPIFEEILRQGRRRRKLLEAVPLIRYCEEKKQIVQCAIEFVLAENDDEQTRIDLFRKLRWAVEEFEEKSQR